MAKDKADIQTSKTIFHVIIVMPLYFGHESASDSPIGCD